MCRAITQQIPPEASEQKVHRLKAGSFMCTPSSDAALVDGVTAAGKMCDTQTNTKPYVPASAHS